MIKRILLLLQRLRIRLHFPQLFKTTKTELELLLEEEAVLDVQIRIRDKKLILNPVIEVTEVKGEPFTEEQMELLKEEKLLDIQIPVYEKRRKREALLKQVQQFKEGKDEVERAGIRRRITENISAPII